MDAAGLCPSDRGPHDGDARGLQFASREDAVRIMPREEDDQFAGAATGRSRARRPLVFGPFAHIVLDHVG